MLPGCSVLLGFLLASPQSTPDLRKVEPDALIAMLPPVGCDGAATTELRRRLADGLHMSDAQWERALLVSQTLRFRSKWPADLPLALSVREPRWTTESGVETGGTQVGGTPRTPGLKSIEGGELMHLGCGLFEDARRKGSDYQEIGRLGTGRHRIVFDVFVDARQGMAPAAGSWSGPLAIDVEIVPSLELALPPIDTPELRDLVRQSLCRFPPSEDALYPPVSVIVA